MAKNKAAQKLGRAGGKKRWAAATKKQRSEAMRALAMKRHGKNIADLPTRDERAANPSK